MWPQFFFVIACLLLPVAWGVIVHQLFELLERSLKKDKRPRDSSYSDYQI
ncbi:hypothetical protein Mal48_42770 [Thalassoglobus polymorphus]|uniref:Uncharacterized protein n=1 Tax=Thalassoglobus polymorphus TaxID=2527994 RepID=A0A517QTN1_9PLAN|nr:hypothetical protein Mal48_42770 [Thalassoglobus polymorphus]